MITQQIFASVIDSQQVGYTAKNTSIERELLPQIPQARGFVSIITGLRRCGKSTLQLQVKNHFFPKEGLFLNFEDPRLAGIVTNDLERLYSEIIARKTKVLFFDEIQIVEGWEIFVNMLLRENFLIYIMIFFFWGH